MHVILVLLGGLAILFLMTHPSQAQALSCAALPAPQEAYRHYDAVIVGSVKQVDSDGNNVNRVHITVTRSYKGVLENATWGSVWGPSVVGETYLFYLMNTADGWENPLCAPSHRIADAQDDLAYLKNKELPISDAGWSASDSSRGWVSYATIGSVVLIVLVAAGIGWTRSRKI